MENTNKNKINDLVILCQPHQPEYDYIKYVLEKIKHLKNNSGHIELRVEFEKQFDDIFSEILLVNKEIVNYKDKSPIIYSKDYKTIIGSFKEFMDYLTLNYSYIEEKKLSDFEDIATERYFHLIESNTFAFLSVSEFLEPTHNDYLLYKKIEDRTIVIELFKDICPKTCFNFLEICKGQSKNKKGETLTYKGCEIFRISRNGFLQSGDLSKLSGGQSVYNSEFEDENFIVKHNTDGIVGMVKNKNMPHTNLSQFYISLSPLSQFDGLFVGFGRVIKGMRLIKRLSEVETYLQRPVNKIEIITCGQYK